jgi:transketolase
MKPYECTSIPALPVGHEVMANAIRALAMDAVEEAKSGHPGMPMGMADVATVLFTRFLKFDAAHPEWPDRDRFVLSAGHGSMLLYALLYLLGYEGVGQDELKRFRKIGSRTAGHPEYGHCPGVETTTGPLGQGIATAVGMAIAERMLNARFGDALVDHSTYVLVGDGCLMEGLSHEAIDLAGHLRLGRLIILFDDNGISIDGLTTLATSMDQPGRFAAAGWSVCRIDGHDPDAIAGAVSEARRTDRPSLIACRTIIGFGAPNKQGSKDMHGSPLGAAEIAATRDRLGWPHPPFAVPKDVLQAWRTVGSRGAASRKAWQTHLDVLDEAARSAFIDQLASNPGPVLGDRAAAVKAELTRTKPTLATRVASQKVLEGLATAQPNLLGGSADLTGSNGTKTTAQSAITANDFSGTYIHYGVREHAMAAAMNGIALHGGFIPYGGTFLTFSDYCRPAIRLSALMGVRVIYVLTHDSIGLGEDGPTHQPVEHLASLRAIPNLYVLRPADAVETVEAWEIALRRVSGPSVLCLSRQNLPTLRMEHTDRNLVGLGAYVLIEPPAERDVTLLATGSEVAIAVEAADALADKGIQAAVVSMPCWELLAHRTREDQDEVLGRAPRIGIEAAANLGWDRWLGRDGAFVGMSSFGASAPAEDLYKHFNLTAAEVVATARSLLAASRSRRRPRLRRVGLQQHGAGPRDHGGGLPHQSRRKGARNG